MGWISMFFQMPLFWIGISLFGWFAYDRPQDCPRKYRVTQEKGGVLSDLGQIHEYCELDYGHRWKLKKEYEEEDEESDMEGK